MHVRVVPLLVLGAALASASMCSPQSAPPSADTFSMQATPAINFGGSPILAVGPGTAS